MTQTKQPYTISSLNSKQIEFLKWLYEDHSKNYPGNYPIPHKNYVIQFSRRYLRNVAISHGMRWAPAWIVKDKKRVSSRGSYAIPEYTNFVMGLNSTKNTETTNVD